MRNSFLSYLLLSLLVVCFSCSTLDQRRTTQPKETLTSKVPKTVDKPGATKQKIIGMPYNRKLYKHWVDVDKDCQDTRAEMLIAKSLVKPQFKKPKTCVVVSGKWLDPYSGKYFYKASQMDIDHVAPLKYAHEHGASVWTRSHREDFANDFDNLIVVSARFNRQKGAKGPSEWMPPNESYHCEYLERWELVQKKYKLEEQKRSTASLSFSDLKAKACNK